MKFTVDPADRRLGETPNVTDPNYLHTALANRLTGPEARPIVFHFRIQLRTATDLASRIDTDIEDATVDWNPQQYPFVDAATIIIPPQALQPEELCESLRYSPWHGLAEHRPLGGINRLRRPVYETSSQRRGAGGCPMSVIS